MSSQIEPAGIPAPSTDAAEWATRANRAARSVTRSFGRRLWFLPGTHIGAVSLPNNIRESLSGPWHYWWQAHYVDCLVDAGRRELASKSKFDGDSRPSAGRLASRLVTTIRLRNLLRFVNDYYDDMAWLALATLRLEKLAEETKKPGRRRNAYVQKCLTLQFDSASTDHLGGGTFWSTKRDFKNTPATAPVALYYARTGHTERAQQLVNWLNSKLLHPERGLYQDGLRISHGEVVVDGAIYTYNQGPVLGALLELGGEDNLRRAALLVDAVRTRTDASRHAGDPRRRHGRWRALYRHPAALSCASSPGPQASGKTQGNGQILGSQHRRSVLDRPPREPNPGQCPQRHSFDRVLFRPPTAGGRNVSGGDRRRAFHATSSLDGTGSCGHALAAVGRAAAGSWTLPLRVRGFVAGQHLHETGDLARPGLCPFDPVGAVNEGEAVLGGQDVDTWLGLQERLRWLRRGPPGRPSRRGLRRRLPSVHQLLRPRRRLVRRPSFCPRTPAAQCAPRCELTKCSCGPAASCAACSFRRRGSSLDRRSSRSTGPRPRRRRSPAP